MTTPVIDTESTEPVTTTTAAVPVTTQKPAVESTPASALDGKKVLVIGNSYVFYGKALISNSVSDTQKQRENDRGYFYQICKAMGSKVSVTDWTFSGHTLRDVFGGPCGESGCKGVWHERTMTNKNFDYVVFSISGRAPSETSAVRDVEYIMDFFRKENPDVKFVCFGNLGCRGYNKDAVVRPGIFKYYKELEEKGVIIADWGGIIDGILDGYHTIEGATQTYNSKTFIVKDKYHPNMLSGYIAALTTYCAITGHSAVGVPYDFCNNKAINSAFDFEAQLSKSYSSTYGTNFPDVFASEADMLGIQKLIDKCLKEKPYIAEADGTFDYGDTGLFDRQRIIIIGNEDIASGCMAISPSKINAPQDDRMGDIGYFYQICRAFGDKAEVTSWCYDGHSLSDIFAEVCPLDGEYHVKELWAPFYDYVFISPTLSDEPTESVLADFDKVINFFKEINPDVKVVCLGSAAVRGYNESGKIYENISNSYAKLTEKGVTVIDWGLFVDKMVKGELYPNGSKVTFSKNTFFGPDGRELTHLTGYISSLLTYCTLTGESAIGTPFAFCADTTLSDKFDFERFPIDYDTNFSMILTSEIEMIPLQMLINDYLGIEYEYTTVEKGPLDGKRVIIIGNSYVYTGRMVVPKGRDYLTQASRTGDVGYFYQLCKSAGSTVSVTNWSFFSHALYNIFGEECTISGDCKGEDHETYLKDKYFDYVIVSANASATAEKNFMSDFEYIMDFFKEANPDVKFVCLGNAGSRGYTSTGGERPGIYNSYKTLEEKGVIIADWGKLVADIIEGKVEVPGATQSYNVSSFILKNGYDSNHLAGYIATLMAYCAITGESAVGMSYDFCDDTSISTRFDFAEYTEVSGYDTNFDDIFKSEADMLGIQKLIDKYLEEKPHMN